jgi:phytoene synthase
MEGALPGAAAVSGAAIPTIADRVRRSGTSFYWAMRLLPRERRQAMYAIYAFCREVDDIADGPLPVAEKRVALQAWREDIDRVFDGAPRTPLARALVGPVRSYQLARGDFRAVLDGVAMDFEGVMVAPAAAELDLYADRVAGAVGRLSVRVFGCAGPDADRVAASLGRALQFTNILRDLAEDAARGRLYLPREVLARHGVAAGDPATVLAHDRLAAACAELAREARASFAEAAAAMARCPRRAMRPAALMAALYRALLDRLERANFRPDARVRVPRLIKLLLVLRWGLV